MARLMRLGIVFRPGLQRQSIRFQVEDVHGLAAVAQFLTPCSVGSGRGQGRSIDLRAR